MKPLFQKKTQVEYHHINFQQTELNLVDSNLQVFWHQQEQVVQAGYMVPKEYLQITFAI